MLSTVEDIQTLLSRLKKWSTHSCCRCGSVPLGHDWRTGAATYNGEETVLGRHRDDDDG